MNNKRNNYNARELNRLRKSYKSYKKFYNKIQKQRSSKRSTKRQLNTMYDFNTFMTQYAIIKNTLQELKKAGKSTSTNYAYEVARSQGEASLDVETMLKSFVNEIKQDPASVVKLRDMLFNINKTEVTQQSRELMNAGTLKDGVMKLHGQYGPPQTLSNFLENNIKKIEQEYEDIIYSDKYTPEYAYKFDIPKVTKYVDRVIDKMAPEKMGKLVSEICRAGLIPWKVLEDSYDKKTHTFNQYVFTKAIAENIVRGEM